MTTEEDYKKLIERENGKLTEYQWEQLKGLAADNANDTCHDMKSNDFWDETYTASLEAYIWDFPL